MKYRNSFVSNSSSTSFTILFLKENEDLIKKEVDEYIESSSYTCWKYEFKNIIDYFENYFNDDLTDIDLDRQKRLKDVDINNIDFLKNYIYNLDEPSTMNLDCSKKLFEIKDYITENNFNPSNLKCIKISVNKQCQEPKQTEELNKICKIISDSGW